MESYEGKAKRVTPLTDGEIAVWFKDDATAFNGKKHALFAGKGALNSEITELFFKELEKRGVITQHIGRTDKVTLKAKRADMFAIEVVVRFRVAGSLKKRTGLDEGAVCDPPIVEFYYKRDDLGDPLINEDHIRRLQLASDAELKTIREMAIAAASHVHDIAAQANMNLVDLKFEFGRTKDGIILADEISPDTCRFRDKATGAILDKDVFRNDDGDLIKTYEEVLRRLKVALGG